MKKKIRTVWKWFLVLSIPVNAISLFIMACCLDSDTPIPSIICLINVGWLLLLAIANEDKDEIKTKKEDVENEISNQTNRAI